MSNNPQYEEDAFVDNRRGAVVCDDDPLIVVIASALLRKEGFDVTAVATGAGLADLLASTSPELIVLDHELPDATGEELVDIIKAAAPACRVIVFSGSTTPAPGSAVFAWVLKQGTDELAAAIRRAAT